MVSGPYCTGVFLFGHFSLSHTFMPVIEECQQVGWVQQALGHSLDISPGNSCVDWIMVRSSTLDRSLADWNLFYMPEWQDMLHGG